MKDVDIIFCNISFRGANDSRHIQRKKNSLAVIQESLKRKYGELRFHNRMFAYQMKTLRTMEKQPRKYQTDFLTGGLHIWPEHQFVFAVESLLDISESPQTALRRMMQWKRESKKWEHRMLHCYVVDYSESIDVEDYYPQAMSFYVRKRGFQAKPADRARSYAIPQSVWESIASLRFDYGYSDSSLSRYFHIPKTTLVTNIARYGVDDGTDGIPVDPDAPEIRDIKDVFHAEYRTWEAYADIFPDE